MAYPRVELGGQPIAIEAGAVAQQYEPLGDGVVLRRSRGAGVKMRHWDRRWSVTVSGSGWLSADLLGLDFDQPLELRCTAPMGLSTTALSVQLPTAVRPDRAPWAFAEVEGRLRRAEVAYAAGVATITPVAGAARYIVRWMPLFNVLMNRPSSGLDGGARSASWSFTAEEA